jgi:uncharacterized membrane protein YkvI
MSRSTLFQRLLLPGFAFKAVVIGGGYATGRELAEFFLPSGARGGLLGMLLAMALWSLICAATFLFAQVTRSQDYRTFFRELLGPCWVAFEVAYSAFIVLILSVFGAAAGEIGAAVFGWPKLAGTLCLVAGIAIFVTFGNDSVERLFKYVSFFLYGVYAVFLLLGLFSFGDRIAESFTTAAPTQGWAQAGLTYAGYNVIGAVIVLPVLRHLTSRRDAVIAGVLCGPLAMLPALFFFACMAAFYPQIGDQALPSNFLLQQLGWPFFQIVFQLMIFAALLESGSGSVHAVNQRIAATVAIARGRPVAESTRLAVAAVVLIVAVFVADRFGLVVLIANGYRLLAYTFLAIYVVPLLTWGAWRLFVSRRQLARSR